MTIKGLLPLLVMVLLIPFTTAVFGQSLFGFTITEPQPYMFSFINPLSTGLSQYPVLASTNNSEAGMVILLPNYYLPLPFNVSSGWYVNVYVWSNASINVYLMSSSQYSSFSSSGSISYIGSASGSIVERSFHVSSGGEYYVVVYNNLAQNTVFIYYEVTISPSPEGTVVPVGIGDYGLGFSKNNLVAYEYTTNMFVGVVTIYGASTAEPGYCPTLNVEPGNRWFSAQLNVVMLVNTTSGITQYYWLQDILRFDSSSDQIQVLDNIWNYTGSSSVLNPSLIHGNGNIGSSAGEYYYDWGISTPQPVSLPLTIYLVIKTGLSNGYPWAAFGYSFDGVHITWYDNVTLMIPATHANIIVSPPNTSLYHPFDAELVIAGPWNRECTVINSLSAKLSLYFRYGAYLVPVPYMWSFGMDTAEAAFNGNATAVGPGTVFVRSGVEEPTYLWSYFILLSIHDALSGVTNNTIVSPGYILNLAEPKYIIFTNRTRYVLVGYVINGTQLINSTGISLQLFGSTSINIDWARQYLVDVFSPVPVLVNGSYVLNYTGWVDSGYLLNINAPKYYVFSNGTRLTFLYFNVTNYSPYFTISYPYNISFAITSPIDFEPIYTRQYLVQVLSVAPIYVNGVLTSNYTGWVSSGSLLNITIPSYFTLNNGTRYAYTGNNTHVMLTVSQPMELSINQWVRQYLVMIISDYPVSINGLVTTNYTDWLNQGGEVTIKPTTVFLNGVFLSEPGYNLVVNKPIKLVVTWTINLPLTIIIYATISIIIIAIALLLKRRKPRGTPM